jgi:hypothetical protein
MEMDVTANLTLIAWLAAAYPIRARATARFQVLPVDPLSMDASALPIKNA